MAEWARLLCLACCTVIIAAEVCKNGQHDAIKGNCSGFRYCKNGKWIELTCIAPLEIFHPQKGECVSASDYQCKLESDHCYPEGDIKPNEECTRYNVCMKGTWVTFQCTNGYAFDTLTSTCVRQENATCYGCDEGIPDPNNCNRYYQCKGTKRISVSCKWFESFDSVSKKCVWFGAKCYPGGACKEENKKSPTSNCKQYEECISGRLYTESCGFSRIFDPAKEKCTWAWPWYRCESNFNTRCTEGQVKTLGCRLYAECTSSGLWQQKECKEGETIRDGKCAEESCEFSAQSCDEYTINGMKVKCGSGSYFDETLSRCIPGYCDSTAAKTNTACKENEALRVKGTCKNYTVCQKGILVNYVCSNCQNFDDGKKKCMFVWDSPCTDGPVTPPTETPTPATETPTPSTETPTTETPTPTTDTPSTETPTPSTETPTTETPTPTTETPSTETPTPSTETPTTETPKPKPQCVSGLRKPDKESCSHYYECNSKGDWEYRACAWYLLFRFDSNLLQCKFWSVHCYK